MYEPHNTYDDLNASVQETLPVRYAPMELLRNGGVAGLLLLGRDVVSVAAVRVRDVSDYAVVDGSAMLQIAYIGLCLCYALYYLIRYRPPGVLYLLRYTPASLLLAYTLLCAVSTLWSSDFELAAFRSAECLCFLLLIVMVCGNLANTCASRQGVIEWLVTWSMWVLFWDTLWFARMTGLNSMFFSLYIFRRGAFALGMLFFLTVFLSRRKLFVLISLVYMPLSLANKTYFGVFFGLVGGLWAGDRRFQVAFFFLVCLVALLLLGMGSAALQHTLFYGQQGVGMQYTSGRDTIWRYCLEVGMRRPWLGYGFVTGETSILWAQGVPAISAHNVFLSALLAVGLSGPILFIGFFVWLFAIVFRADLPDHWRPAFVGTAIMVLIISAAAPGLGTRVYGSWIPALLASMGMCTVAKWEELLAVNGQVEEDYGSYPSMLAGQEFA